MTKYKGNFIATIILCIGTIAVYFLKSLTMVPEGVKMMLYILVCTLNVIIFINTLVSIKPMKKLLKCKLHGENAKNKVGFLLNIIKDITDTKTSSWYFFIACCFTVGMELAMFFTMAFKTKVYDFANIILDIITVLCLCNTYIQTHINYTIHRYLEEEK